MVDVVHGRGPRVVTEVADENVEVRVVRRCRRTEGDVFYPSECVASNGIRDWLGRAALRIGVEGWFGGRG